jgi:hypothetical protein
MSQPAGNLDGLLAPEAIRCQLARVLNSPNFVGAGRLKQFLSFVVNQVLDGNREGLKEQLIGVRVFDRPLEFDPGSDTIVRTTAARLRKVLLNYYETDGKHDDILIELPKGGYTPRFVLRVPPSVPSPPATSRWAVIGFWGVVASILLLSGSLILKRPRQALNEPPKVRMAMARRLLANSTSEGQELRRIEAGRHFEQLVMKPDGDELYAFEKELISVLRVRDLKLLARIPLPNYHQAAFITRDGARVYVSLRRGGVMVLDTKLHSLAPAMTGTEHAIGLAVSGDNRRLFLALGRNGLKRIDLKTGEGRILSSIACPTYLNIDRAGTRLYVAYQCGGPGGREGHDVVEIYDLNSETRAGLIKDLTMVNGQPLFAPNDEVVLLNVRDACTNPDYDHVGCPFPSALGFHLLRPEDRLITSSHWFKPADFMAGGEFFPSGTRIALLGSHLVIWDWARQFTIESLDRSETKEQNFAITPSQERAFVSLGGEGGLLVLDAEAEACMPIAEGLTNFYTGDGTTDDALGEGRFKAKGGTGFAPGYVGQAFQFDGKTGYLQARGGSRFCPYCADSWSVSFFVKFQTLTGEMALLNKDAEDGSWDFSLTKSADHYLRLTDHGQPEHGIRSTSPVREHQWHHVAVTTHKGTRSLFLDGVMQANVPVSGRIERSSHWDMGMQFVGSIQGKRSFLHGKIDELAIYNRPLTEAEILKMSKGCSMVP